MPDFIYMLETRFTPEQQAAVRLVQQVAREHGMNVYLAGGAVRDLFTGFQVRDLDFTVEGNALKLQKDLEKAGGALQGINEELRVLYMLLPGRVRAEISSARTEVYPKPSRPEVKPSSMVEDLRRRDFTANAMALSLNPGSYLLFMDPMNGVADIEAKHLRGVNNYGFYEDPSRMIRAARFLARFGWTMEERTATRYATAKESDYIDGISKTALGYELEQLLHEPDPLNVMRALETEGYLKLMYPGWSPAKVDEAGLQRVQQAQMQLAGLGLNADASMVNAEFLTKRMAEKDVQAMHKMMPIKGFVDQWRHQEEEAKDLAKRLTSKEADTPSHTWKLLMAVKPEATLYLAVTTKQAAVEKKLDEFFNVWPQARQRMPYAMMAEMRITPELPVYQTLLEEMFLQMIDGKLKNEQEIRAFLEPHSPPLPAPPPSFGRRARAKKAVKKAATKSAKAAAPKQEAAAPMAVAEKAVAAVPAKAAAVSKAHETKAAAKAPTAEKHVAKKAPEKVAAKATKHAGKKTTQPARKVNVADKLKRKPAVGKKAVAKAKARAHAKTAHAAKTSHGAKAKTAKKVAAKPSKSAKAKAVKPSKSAKSKKR